MENNSNPSLSHELAQRKGDHIELAKRARTSSQDVDVRFNYEPLFFTHPTLEDCWPITFLKKELSYPIWVSSMTGGAQYAENINVNLARLAGKYKLGMGLGSCRALLHDDEYLKDFDVRDFLGDQPLLANLGIAQVEELVKSGKTTRIHEMVKKLRANGLIIHINPLQEWFQPEGDRYHVSPLMTMTRFLETTTYPVFVKEVGQGLGPKSLQALLKLPLAGVEFGAFGGTNFSLLESFRGDHQIHKMPFVKVGHTASEMVSFLNKLPMVDKEFIISGGQKNILDAFELKSKLQAPALMGFASAFLAPAMESFDVLEEYFLGMRDSLLTARNVLELKEE